MSLYGALASGVSGLKAQENKISIISDNISNINTVGYKRGEGSFQTLVTGSGTVSYAPGGVLANNRKQITEQGLLVTTSSNTDVAISGNGMFVVKTAAAATTGTIYYTRAGSFRADATGNFQNAAGYYLQGWPLDREGRIPGEAGNANTASSTDLTSLQTVNVASLTGVAASTTRIDLSANLRSTETTYPGSGVEVDMDSLSTENLNLRGKDIIVPTSTNNLTRGDSFTITNGDGSINKTFTYDGFTFGRNVTTAEVGDNAVAITANPTPILGNNPFSTTAGSDVVNVRHANHGLATGDVITISGITTTGSPTPTIGGIPASELNDSFVITVVDDNNYTIQTTSSASSAVTVPDAISMVSNNAPSGGPASITMTLPAGHGFVAGQTVTIADATAFDNITALELNSTFTITAVTATSITFTIPTIAGDPAGAVTGGGAAANAIMAEGGSSAVQLATRPFAGNILDATTATGSFLGTTGTSAFSAAALTFSVTTTTTGTVTFSYSSTANASQKTFNTLTNLATAINGVSGLSARVANNRLYISATDANEAVTFANGDVIGDGTGSSIKRGINWTDELGLKNVTQGSSRFTNKTGLTSVVNSQTGLSATLNNELSTNATVEMFIDNPLDTITFSDRTVSTAVTTFVSETITTSTGSETIVIAQSNHGYSVGDVIRIDPTSMTNYPSAVSATNKFTTNTTAGTQNVISVSQTGHGFTNGDEVFFDMSSVTSTSIGGIPTYELNGLHTVTVVDANTYTISVQSNATSVATTGAGTFVASPTINGIPLTDFHGSFVVKSVGGVGSYSIEMAHAATSASSPTAADLEILTPTNGGSVVAELGLTDSLNDLGTTTTTGFGTRLTTEQTTGALGPAYDASDITKNMASGSIDTQYFTNVRVYDSLGTGHDLRVAFIKTQTNTWAAEIYAVPADQLDENSYPNGLIANGTLVFNGDGTLNSVDSTLSSELTIPWVNGSTSSAIAIDWGTSGALGTGRTDGLSQFDANYKLNFANQNGVPVGELIGVEISSLGVVTARFSNGERQDIFKIPLASFANYDGLDQVTGNVFSETNVSGTVNLRAAGESGTGTLQASTLESSNADVAQQLTDMIVAQRAYQASTKTITTANSLLEELSRIIQ